MENTVPISSPTHKMVKNPSRTKSDGARCDSSSVRAAILHHDSQRHIGQGEGRKSSSESIDKKRPSRFENKPLHSFQQDASLVNTARPPKRVDILYPPKQIHVDSSEFVPGSTRFDCSGSPIDFSLHREWKPYQSSEANNVLSSGDSMNVQGSIGSSSLSNIPRVGSGFSDKPSLEWDFAGDVNIKEVHTQTSRDNHTIDACTSGLFPADHDRLEDDIHTALKAVHLSANADRHELLLRDGSTSDTHNPGSFSLFKSLSKRVTTNKLEDRPRVTKLAMDPASRMENAVNGEEPQRSYLKRESLPKVNSFDSYPELVLPEEKPSVILQPVPVEGSHGKILTSSFEICNNTDFLKGYKIYVNDSAKHLKITPSIGLILPHTQVEVSVSSNWGIYDNDGLSKYAITVKAFQSHCNDTTKLEHYFKVLNEQHPELIDTLTIDRILIWNPDNLPGMLKMINSIENLSERSSLRKQLDQETFVASKSSYESGNQKTLNVLEQEMIDSNKRMKFVHTGLSVVRNTLDVTRFVILWLVGVVVIMPAIFYRPVPFPFEETKVPEVPLPELEPEIPEDSFGYHSPVALSLFLSVKYVWNFLQSLTS